MTVLKDLRDSLQASVRGEVYASDDPNFAYYATVFNGNVKTAAKAVVCPLDAEDVSKIILFCRNSSLSLSIKAGGYGTAGWAINGDVIIDLCRINGVDIEAPGDEGSFTSLRDMAPPNSKGKKAVTSTVSVPGKRRREEDDALRDYSSASHSVENFLRGPQLPKDDNYPDRPPPTNRRRLDPPVGGDGMEGVGDGDAQFIRPDVQDGGQATGDGTTSPSSMKVLSTLRFPPSSSIQPSAPVTSRPPAPNADPFGYLDGPPAPPSMSSQSSSRNFNGGGGSTTVNTVVTNPHLPPANMNFRSHSEPVHPYAYFSFGAGMRQKEIDTYAANHPLEAKSLTGDMDWVPYHVPFAAHPVGSANMMLGGFGFLSRLHGLSIDNLVEAEMVLADGRIVFVDENNHPDLWWALRGAGPCYGIATRYKAKAYPVPSVFAGNLIYRFHRATASSLLRHFRDCVKGAPRELYANVLLTAGPKGKDSLIVIQMCFVGARERGQEFLSAISSWGGEPCLLNEVDEKSFLHQQDSVAQVLRGKAGRQWFIRSALITSLPDDVINKTVAQFADTPLGCTWLFELAGGALLDHEDSCLPKKQREAAWTVAALHQWDMGVDDPRCISSAEEWISKTLAPVQTGGPLPSFLGRHEPAERTMASYGDNWGRLKEIKRLYDPDNVFRNTLWPLDAEGEATDPRTHEPMTP